MMKSLFILASSILALGACSGPRPIARGQWESTYQTRGESAETQPVDLVEIKNANYDLLAEGKVLAGYEALGESRFREVDLPAEEFLPESPLANMARRKGATLVLIGKKYAGKEPRTQYIRRAVPGDLPPPGEPNRGGTHTEVVPEEVPTDVFDYIAVFCRERK